MACAIKKERDELNNKRKTYSGLCNIPKARAIGVKSEIAIKPGRLGPLPCTRFIVLECLRM